VKAAVLYIGTISRDLTNHFDAKHVGFEKILARRADFFRHGQRCADEHAGGMADMYKRVPVVEIEGVS